MPIEKLFDHTSFVYPRGKVRLLASPFGIVANDASADEESHRCIDRWVDGIITVIAVNLFVIPISICVLESL